MAGQSLSISVAVFAAILSVLPFSGVSETSCDCRVSERIPMSYSAVNIGAEPRSIGTAWPIALGYAVTSNHVVGDSDQVTLITGTGTEISARVMVRDLEHDLVILSVSDPGKLPAILPRAVQAANPGANVFTLGYSKNDFNGGQPQLSYGIISSEDVGNTAQGVYRVLVAVQPGNSGSPVLNMRGEVIGLVSSSLGRVDPNGEILLAYPHTTYVAGIDALRDLIEYLPRRGIIGTYTKSEIRSLDSLAARIRHSVMMVVAH